MVNNFVDNFCELLATVKIMLYICSTDDELNNNIVILLWCNNVSTVHGYRTLKYMKKIISIADETKDSCY